MTTLAPRAANSRAMPFPMPRPAPVTMATLPCRDDVDAMLIRIRVSNVFELKNQKRKLSIFQTYVRGHASIQSEYQPSSSSCQQDPGTFHWATTRKGLS